MIVDRRMALAGLMGGAVLGVAPAQALACGRTAVLFIDSRRPATRAFVAGDPDARIIDIARPHAVPWAEVRAFSPAGGRIRGLTRWSDWILLRGILQEKGLRVRAETPLDPVITHDAALFVWEMA